MAEAKQIKSKKRVADHGEVFTSEREVNAMLDLVKQETERIDSRFLEPACGDGNFLAEILRRKLAVVKRQYGKSPLDYEKYAVTAATSIYGVDILQDNVEACRRRMFDIWDKAYKAACKGEVSEDCRNAVRYIFKLNILCGNALSMKKVDENGHDTDEPIIFAEWSVFMDGKVKRSDYRLDVLLIENTDEDNYTRQFSLFGEDPTGVSNWMIDPETKELVPKPTKDYPPVNYRRVQDNG